MPFNQLSFQRLTKREGCILHFCKTEEIIKFELVGKVDLEAIQHVTGFVFQQLKLTGSTKLLIDRTTPHQFSDEANGWMKSFLLGNRHRLNPKLTRVAILSSEAKKMGMYAHFMKTAFQVIFPGVKLASFEFEDSAIVWMS